MNEIFRAELIARKLASLKAAGLLLVNQAINGPLMLAVVCFMLALIFAVQLSVVGGLDRLGISPQHSFLALNLAMISALATLLCYPRLKHHQQYKPDVGTSFVVDESSVGLPLQPTEFTCKLLIIRRLAAVKALQTTTQRLYERKEPHAIVVADWFSGS